MLVTEEEARRKRCPANIPNGIPGHCVTSHCMAWRWSGLSTEGKHLGYCGLAGEPEEA